MSESIREQAQWRRGKSPIIAKYSDDHAKLFSEIAGKGFLALPGYAYELENNLEISTKRLLSDLNLKILSETIERELKQTGLDYGLAYKNALIVWELEKQTLLSAWEAEYAGIKRGMEIDEEVLNRLAIEVSRRAITLLENKVAIELEMEALRASLVQLDASVSPYEVQLANAKLLTAQRKVSIIPVLQEILEKEQELLILEQSKVEAYTELAEAEREVGEKKRTLIPHLNALATKVEEHAIKIVSDQIPAETRIAEEKITQSNVAIQKANAQVTEQAAELEVENGQLTLMESKRELATAHFENGQELIGKENELTVNYRDVQDTKFDEIISSEREFAASNLSDKASIHGIKNGARVTSATTISNATKSHNTDVSNLEIDQMRRKADIDAAAEITAQLTHLIG